jgi:hypothetical protein
MPDFKPMFVFPRQRPLLPFQILSTKNTGNFLIPCLKTLASRTMKSTYNSLLQFWLINKWGFDRKNLEFPDLSEDLQNRGTVPKYVAGNFVPMLLFEEVPPFRRKTRLAFLFAVAFLKQPPEVFVFSPGRLKVKDLILDAHPQVIQQFLQSVDAFFEFRVAGLRLLGKLSQFIVVRVNSFPKFFDQFIKLRLQSCFVHHIAPLSNASSFITLIVENPRSPLFHKYAAKFIPKHPETDFPPNLRG